MRKPKLAKPTSCHSANAARDLVQRSCLSQLCGSSSGSWSRSLDLGTVATRTGHEGHHWLSFLRCREQLTTRHGSWNLLMWHSNPCRLASLTIMQIAKGPGNHAPG